MGGRDDEGVRTAFLQVSDDLRSLEGDVVVTLCSLAPGGSSQKWNGPTRLSTSTQLDLLSLLVDRLAARGLEALIYLLGDAAVSGFKATDALPGRH